VQTVQITKPNLRWLFGGVGFHNSEASMIPIMSPRFKNEIALKTFREISPSFSRVFAGFANWTREAMDAFADYYDETFRKSGTLLYVVPGRMPMMMDDFNMEDYCEQVAVRMKYLIQERKCTKIRYYCVTNELSVGNTYAFLATRLELFKELHACLYKAFARHGLDVGLIATDCSGTQNFGQIKWAIDNMDEITDAYCAHLYVTNYAPGDPDAYDYLVSVFTPEVMHAHAKQKRFILGEYGYTNNEYRRWCPMNNDVSYNVAYPEAEADYALAVCEMAMAAINTGCFAAVLWTMIDYPDPFIREDGDTPEEKDRYQVARFSGAGLDYRYNKWGLIRWCEDEQDYSSRASLYTMGYMAKLFKKGSRVLVCNCGEDKQLRCSAVTNQDGSVSIAVINWENAEKEIRIELEHRVTKPLRVYECAAQHIPYNAFNDLQDYSQLLNLENGGVTLKLQPRSITFLTTDYIDRVPSKIRNIRKQPGQLRWDACEDPEHCYYRVFAGESPDFTPGKENQIASTVAQFVQITEPALCYKVFSVDRWGNIRKM